MCIHNILPVLFQTGEATSIFPFSCVLWTFLTICVHLLVRTQEKGNSVANKGISA